MRIVLATLNAKYIHSSLALRTLRAYAKPSFPDIALLEFTIKDPLQQIVSEIYRCKPDVIAFSIYIWNVRETLPIVRTLRKVLPDARIILGGPEVSYDTRELMLRVPEVDVVVQGEGEASFLHLLQTYEGKGDLAEVRGIMFREDGEIRANPPRAKLDLEQAPSPYTDEELETLQSRIVYFETSRGCPFSCQFCLSSIESGVRYFPLERVKAELMRLIDTGIKTVKFVDRTFNLNRQYARELFQFLIDNRRDTVFQFEITGDILPPDIVDFLAHEAPPGLFRFEIGIQSTNDVTNTLVKRRQNFVKLSRTITSIKTAGNIVQHLDLIAGLPEEDYTSFRKTFNEVFAFEPEELQLGFLKMLRGTGLRERASMHDYVYMDEAPYEILSNNVLTFEDILRIKQVEDVLEKYWNDNRLRHTVRYLTSHAFESAFDFFQSFGTYWESSGWSRIGHQLADLFTRLLTYLEFTTTTDIIETAKSWMMVEYLLAHRIRPHHVWWVSTIDKRIRTQLADWLIEHPTWLGEQFFDLQLSRAELEKHVVLEQLPRVIQLTQEATLDCASLEKSSVSISGAHAATSTDVSEVSDSSPGLLAVYYPPGIRKGDVPYAFTAPWPTVSGIPISRDLRALSNS